MNAGNSQKINSKQKGMSSRKSFMGMFNQETPTVELRSLQPTVDPSDRNSFQIGRPSVAFVSEQPEVPDSIIDKAEFGAAQMKGDFRRTQEDRVRNRFSLFSLLHIPNSKTLTARRFSPSLTVTLAKKPRNTARRTYLPTTYSNQIYLKRPRSEKVRMTFTSQLFKD